ncbi:MAG: ATP-binding cassette domain-containing protein [Flavobacteriales bacterium]|jgi:phospholipid/cholesterol/gamma-HCH transport system ATP-binding protein|nr:ATP-binding cassette domain-containing protein [Flavobacteriales bacterium]MBK6551147.1 ATP-binding cassette domain-containing protein [Flavobacteriales bacterium]MBK6883678.1 ATP-binding cassette domain-containing protein [Flavobacteriales bacterium]MBK7101065.1 ATP-binding cassette domain-containing protein [Flavobacteriales bacterium]MBK7111781.1 ATP-binding cassette domain-containing protein [Flavobacteriales bacterium]
MEPSAHISPAQSAISDEVVVRIRGLHKAFGSNHVLRGFDVDLHRGENVMVLGKSGSGKSVLIKCIIGLLPTDAGTIEVLGHDILALRHEALDRMRVRIGFLFQSNALYDSMTVRENLEFPMRRHLSELSADERMDRVVTALTDVGLAHTMDLMPSELSGGMRKRVGLARTLIMRPEIVLYDEPTTGLDPITSREIVELILDLQREYGTSSILISHDLNVAKLAANRVIVLHEGRAHAQGTYDELMRSTDPVVRRFFDSL